MASSKQQRLEGGYACEFIEEPAKELQTECSVCLHVLCKPDMVSCCGEKFCHSCIEQVIKKKKPCPHCNNPQFDTMADKKLDRELCALKVYCTNKDEGCEWVGNLRDLEKHRNCINKSIFVDVQKGCDYEKIECTKCKREIQRCQFSAHLLKGCSVPDGECQFNFVGCKAKVSGKEMKQHLEENMAVHLSLLIDLTRNLSNENARNSELLGRLSTEVEDGQMRRQQQGERGELVLRKQQGAGEVLHQHRRRKGRSIALWIIGVLMVLLLSVLAGQNKDTMTDLVGGLVRGNWRYVIINQDHDMLDHSEITLALTDIEDKVNIMAKDMDALKHSVNDNQEKIQVTMDDLRKLRKAAEGWNTMSENVASLKSQLPDDLRLKLDTLSSDLSKLDHTMKDLVNKEDLLLRQRLDVLTGLQRELDSLKLKVDNLQHPLSRDEVAKLVVAELEARPPPHHPPPHHPHPHHHGHGHGHGHGRGGCRGHH